MAPCAALRRAARDRTGFSLVELLVVVAVLGLTMAGILGLLRVSLESYGLGASRVEAQQSARVALERMVKELREAGYDPTGAGVVPIVEAGPTHVAFQRDLDGDGLVDATRERVTFLLRGTVLRRDAGAGAQPIINGVRSFALTYFDHEGRPTTDPASVRSIQIQLATGLAGPAILMQTQVSMRNGLL